MTKALSIALLACAASCASNPTRPTAIVLGQPFDLRPGDSARLADGLAIRFDGVRSDSRCPIDVQCVSAGDAIVAIAVSLPAGGRVDRELHTRPDLAETVVNDYTIRLTSLTPSPRTDRPIRPDDYIATLIISRR
jgi:hypothetical protein